MTTPGHERAGVQTNITRAMRIDLQLIADMIEPRARALDVGCGDGALLEYLATFKQVDGRGIELSMSGVNVCISRGLSVIQGDADTDLKDYPDDAFDFVILSNTLQAMVAPRDVLGHMMRIGRHAIVSFPNFAYWRIRLDFLLGGRMPKSDLMPNEWYDTPNIHLCSIRDFVALCGEMGFRVERSLSLDSSGRARGIGAGFFAANLFGEQAVFLLTK